MRILSAAKSPWKQRYVGGGQKKEKREIKKDLLAPIAVIGRNHDVKTLLIPPQLQEGHKKTVKEFEDEYLLHLQLLILKYNTFPDKLQVYCRKQVINSICCSHI